MQREERRHVAAEVWMAAGGRGHWIKTPIRVKGGCGMEGGVVCVCVWGAGWGGGLLDWRRTASPLYLL